MVPSGKKGRAKINQQFFEKRGFSYTQLLIQGLGFFERRVVREENNIQNFEFLVSALLCSKSDTSFFEIAYSHIRFEIVLKTF